LKRFYIANLMGLMQTFFVNLGFTFDKDIVKETLHLSDNKKLSNKLSGNLFAYNNESSNSSFCLILIPLSEKELFEIKRYFWNKDKYDLFFYFKESDKISLNYAKSNPRKQSAKIDEFKIKGEDEQKLRRIQKWQFDSGAFWTNYSDFIRNIKHNERIDKKLVEQLKLLRNDLEKKIGKDKTEEIQALIDRMLFIKFLEDNHIINSDFYQHYFGKGTNYKLLLQENDPQKINQLYYLLNKIFSNRLFASPTIEEDYISNSSLSILSAIQEDKKSSQLRLFDFQFDVIPIEFISHIYEVFLEKDQRDEGIYYTPPKLAHLIIDEVISETGTVLDPACGSGMFLILSYRKILQKSQIEEEASISEIIEHRIKLLKKYIFGIEKKNTAWRLTIFALYLEVLKGLNNEDIKEYVKQKIVNGNEIIIFPDFSQNIINGNSLEIGETKLHFVGNTFKYIVGNPPFFKIKQDKDNEKELSFLKNYFTEINGRKIYASKIIGDNQISQAFMLKIKDWANANTKFGFVQNSSNFYNDNSVHFQDFFFSQYQIETFYELSRVRKILFERAGEPVVVTIFNNKNVLPTSIIKYYPVDLELYSKEFNLLIIQEDKRIDLRQKLIQTNKIVLRDYLIGNEYDLELIRKISDKNKLDEYLFKDEKLSFEGLKRIGNKKLESYYSLSDFNKFSNNEKALWHEKFAFEKYLSKNEDNYYDTPYIYQPTEIIESFRINNIDGYINKNDVNKHNFQRIRSMLVFEGKKIVVNRFGNKIKAAYSNKNLFFSNLIYGIKLQDEKLYPFITALLNSELIEYFLTLKYRRHDGANMSNITTAAIRNIPIPEQLDENIISEITELSQDITDEKLEYDGEDKALLNELIYDLYELSFYERQRIKDSLMSGKTILEKNKTPLKEYKQTLKDMFELYFTDTPRIESYIDNVFGSGITVVAIYFNGSKNSQVSSKKILTYSISEELLKSSSKKFTLLQNRIVGKDCVYLIKNSILSNWSITKAFEDAKDIIKLAK